jgi:UDPglucose 6-dehydrogenase
MDISIVGAGYVGLVSGACLAARGHRVVCVDVDEERSPGSTRAYRPFTRGGSTTSCAGPWARV